MSELYWIFYDDDKEALEEYFKTGGTIENDTLYNCINEGADDCYPILINHIKVIPNEVWRCLLNQKEVRYFYDLIQRGYSIPYKYIIEFNPNMRKAFCGCCSYTTSIYICIQDGIKNIAKAHREAITLLCIAKRMVQPMSSLLKMIAMEYVWALHDSATIYRCSKCGKEGF